jgi:hypothetical protein
MTFVPIQVFPNPNPNRNLSNQTFHTKLLPRNL